MNYTEIKIAIIGSGRWGLNHVRTACSLLPHNNIYVVDSNDAQKERVDTVSTEVNFITDINLILEDSSISAVIIATPAETHFDLAKLCLENNKNVLVEKPISLQVDHAEELQRIAESKSLKLMVGHVLLYHPAVLKMKELINEGNIGDLQYIYSNRLNLGAIRSEENILWSFAPHDISVIQYLTSASPTSVHSNGATFLQHKIEDTTLTYLEYPNNVKAHIFVSWLHPFKEQRLVVIGDKGMIVFEDSLKTEKLKFFKKGFMKKDGALEKFDNEYDVVEFESKMPLSEEHVHFYDSIINNTTPRTDGVHAVEVLKILSKATKSLEIETVI
jgi:UDP-2-acetamido-3-amino-2,3-dideoxy-glucuronate N-acetyltransferase